MNPGASLPPLEKGPVTTAQLARYAVASGDHNPIHLDDETARRMGLGGVIAHGMLSMGFLGQFVAALAGPGRVRRLKVRFSAMVRPGDRLSCRGTVREVRATGRAVLDVWAENQRGERVTAGEAEIDLPEGDGDAVRR